MYRSIVDRVERAPGAGEVVERRGRAAGLVLDRRAVSPTAGLQSGEFFRGEPQPTNEVRFLTAR